jgi:tRNA pseudouridine13 synthase
VLASDECLEIESAILAQYADLCKGLEAAGLTQERRALRAIPEKLRHAWLDDGALKLTFSLGPGIFATTLLAEIGDIQPSSAAPEAAPRTA